MKVGYIENGVDVGDVYAGREFIERFAPYFQYQAWSIPYMGAVSEGYVMTNNNVVLGDATGALLTTPPWSKFFSRLATDGDINTHFTWATKKDGSVWRWGKNNIGQLGNGTTNEVMSPNELIGFGGASLSTSKSTCFLIKPNGTLWVVGSGFDGLSGGAFPSGTTASSPCQIGSGASWSLVHSGSESNHASAIRMPIGSEMFPTLWTWGLNSEGQLGDGTVVSRSSPVQIAGAWREVKTGQGYTLAIKTDGSLWGWGTNLNGELGDGTRINKSSPVQIGSRYDWISIDTTKSTSAGITADSALWLWGVNAIGQIGDGTTQSRSSPVQIGNKGWGIIRTSLYCTAAVGIDGTIWTWGSNNNYQLGTVDGISKSSPVQVGITQSWLDVYISEKNIVGLTTGGVLE